MEIKVSSKFISKTGLPFFLSKTVISTEDTNHEGWGEFWEPRGARIRSEHEAWERMAIKQKGIDRSHGFAASQDYEAACIAAKLEYIERSVVEKAWSTMNGWVPLPQTTLIQLFYLNTLKRLGWTISNYAILTTSEVKVMVGFGFHSQFGIIMDAQASLPDSLNQKKGHSKLLRSLLRAAYLRPLRIAQKAHFSGNQLIQAGPQARDHYYSNRDKRAALSFLDSETSRLPIDATIPNLSDLQTRILLKSEPTCQRPWVVQAYCDQESEPQFWGPSKGANPWPIPFT